MGWPVVVLQFVKSGEWKVGEEKIGRQLGVEWHSLGDGFTWDSDEPRTATRPSPDGPGRQRRRSSRPASIELVILDELTYLCTWGWIDTDRRRRRRCATGPTTSTSSSPAATARAEIIEIADTVTEMRKVKHAYDNGIGAKKGIEY